MSDEMEQKTSGEIQQEAGANVTPTDELAPEELNNVNGGSIVKVVDKSSPKLYTACATGEHIKSATITV